MLFCKLSMMASFIPSVVWQAWLLKTKDREVGASQSITSKEVSSSLVAELPIRKLHTSATPHHL